MNNTHPKKTFFKSKSFLFIIGFLAALMLSEFGVRAFFHFYPQYYDPQSAMNEVIPLTDGYEKKGAFKGKYDSRPLLRYSNYLGFYPLENYEGNGYQSNQYGFRYNEDFPIEKPKNEIRIFITGGSAAWGQGVAQESTYSTILEKKLQQNLSSHKIRVVNAGVSAYLSTHERILIINKIMTFKPDIILMFSGWNDTYAGSTGISAFDDRWDFFKVSPILSKHHAYFAAIDNPLISLDFPYYKDYAIKLHYLIDRIILSQKMNEYIQEFINKKQLPPQEIVENLIQNIRITNHIAKQSNTSLIFYLQPTLFHSKKILSRKESLLMEIYKYHHKDFIEYNFLVYNLFRKHLKPLAFKENFDFIDGDESIAKEKDSVFIDYVHFGDRGNRLIAEHMFTILKPQIARILSNNESLTFTSP